MNGQGDELDDETYDTGNVGHTLGFGSYFIQGFAATLGVIAASLVVSAIIGVIVLAILDLSRSTSHG
jgi:hypothetical protein